MGAARIVIAVSQAKTIVFCYVGRMWWNAQGSGWAVLKEGEADGTAAGLCEGGRASGVGVSGMRKLLSARVMQASQLGRPCR